MVKVHTRVYKQDNTLVAEFKRAVLVPAQEPRLSIFLRPARLAARRRARAAAVKDLFDTAGLTTTYGSAVFADHVPARTASAVEALERAGWANVGKTNLHEFAYGITSQNPHYGTVPNPAAPGRVAGGSSGGSAAALAAGLAEGALGTDSGGSIRIPAAWCGVVGFKPSFGLVSIDGCFPLAPSFDHAGPMARDVATCAEMTASAGAAASSRSRLDSLRDLRIAGAGGVDLQGAERGRAAADAARSRLAFMREVAEVARAALRRNRIASSTGQRRHQGRALPRGQRLPSDEAGAAPASGCASASASCSSASTCW